MRSGLGQTGVKPHTGFLARARHAVITSAVVLDGYNTRPVPSQTGGPDSYDRLADVRFTASGQREQARS